MTNLNGSSSTIKIANTDDYIASQKALESLGAVHIGNICSWDVQDDISLTYEQYKAIASRLGISDRYLVSEKSPLVAFGKAWRGVKKPKGMKATELKHTRQEGDLLMVAFYKQEGRGKSLTEAELEINHQITVSFHKEHFTVEAIPKSSDYIEDAARLVDEIRDLYNKSLNVSSEDIQTTSANFCRHAGISIQPRGGSYFIPRTQDDAVQAMRSLYSEVSQQSLFLTIPAYSSPSGNADIGKAAGASLLGDVDEIDLEVFQMCLSASVQELLHGYLAEAIAYTNDNDRNFATDAIGKAKTKLTSSLKKEADAIIAMYVKASNQEICQAIANLKAKIEIKDNTREKTLRDRSTKIKELSDKIFSFQDFIGSESDRLTETLDRLNTYTTTMHTLKFGDKYDENIDITPQTKPAPTPTTPMPLSIPTPAPTTKQQNTDDDDEVGF